MAVPLPTSPSQPNNYPDCPYDYHALVSLSFSIIRNKTKHSSSFHCTNPCIPWQISLLPSPTPELPPPFSKLPSYDTYPRCSYSSHAFVSPSLNPSKQSLSGRSLGLKAMLCSPPPAPPPRIPTHFVHTAPMPLSVLHSIHLMVVSY